MGGWEIVTAILGVATIMASAYVNIWKAKNPTEPTAIHGQVSERIAKLEEANRHHGHTNKRLQDELTDSRKRHDQVVDDIYGAINDLRNLVIKNLKNS